MTHQSEPGPAVVSITFSVFSSSFIIPHLVSQLLFFSNPLLQSNQHVLHAKLSGWSTYRNGCHQCNKLLPHCLLFTASCLHICNHPFNKAYVYSFRHRFDSICITYSLRRDHILITSLILLQPQALPHTHYITDTILQPQAWHHLQPQTWPYTHHLHCYSHRLDHIHITSLTSQGMTYVLHYLLCYSHRLDHILYITFSYRLYHIHITSLIPKAWPCILHHLLCYSHRLDHTYYITYTTAQGLTTSGSWKEWWILLWNHPINNLAE